MDNPVIITNIISAAKEVGQDSNLKIVVLLLTAGLTLFSNLILKFIDWLKQSRRIKYEKKKFYFDKTCALIDQGVDMLFRMVYNKMMIAYKKDPIDTWQNNIFLLHKDVMYIESLLSIYAPLEVVLAFADLRQYIFELKDEKAVEKWYDIYEKTCESLEIVRKSLGVVFDINYDKFMKDIRTPIPREDIGSSATAEFQSQLTSRR